MGNVEKISVLLVEDEHMLAEILAADGLPVRGIYLRNDNGGTFGRIRDSDIVED